VSSAELRPIRQHRVRRPWQTVAIVAAVAIAFLIVAVASVVPISSDTARAKLVAALASRLDSEVQLDSLQVHVFPTLRAEGAGLIIRHHARHDVPPLISIRRFTVNGSAFELLRRHVATVKVEGLDIEIPPGGLSAAGGDNPGTTPDAQTEGADAGRPRTGRGAAGTLVIDQLVSTDAHLVILPRKADKAPKIWAIHDLHMQSVAFDNKMPFQATLTNAVPPGEIATNGTFGPWQAEDPGETPLGGNFTFDHADLSVFNGISGILSAKGTFGGQLATIDVRGDTNTPQFTITDVGHPIPLAASYHAIVDGTNGDTILERIEGRFLNTSLVASGDVVDLPGAPGRQVTLDLTMDGARLEDLLWLAVKARKPPMNGSLTLKTKMILPPGKEDVVRKLRLDGSFSLARTRFTDAGIQRKIEELSQRSRGKTAQRAAEAVTSDFKGSFKLAKGVLRLPMVSFDVPGALVRLSGKYGLTSEAIDFSGTLNMHAKVSETTTGIKSVLLKAVDPLFKGRHGGSVIPIKISGSRDNPSFGLDKGRLFKR
jgi:hypothetical protein